MRSRSCCVLAFCLTFGGVLFAFGLPALAVTQGEISAASPFLFGDLQTFNWRILNQVNPAVPVPATPTGNQTGFIRMYTNGNTHNPAGTPAVVWTPDGPTNPGSPSPPNFPDTFNVDGFGVGGVPEGTSSLYYGLDFSGGGSPTVASATTVGTIANFVTAQTPLNAGDPVSPVFGFDQNQEGADPDIFLRARLMLVDPSLIPTNSTMTAAAVDAALAAASAAQIRTFTFFDNPPGAGLGFTEDDPLLAGDDDQWVLLPGLYDPDGPAPGFLPVDNNTAGNNADWGGFLVDNGNPLDLLNVKADDGVTAIGADWLFLVDLKGLGDNNGKEEAYILGGLAFQPPPQTGVTPEPTTAVLALLGVFGVVGWRLRRG